MTKPLVLARAEWDLEDFHDYFENEQEGVVAKFIDAFQRGLDRIDQFPERYARYLRAVRICPLEPLKWAHSIEYSRTKFTFSAFWTCVKARGRFAAR